MRKTWLAMSCASVLAASAAFAADGSIGVYLDDAGTQCQGPISGPASIGSVWMTLGGATAGGITGVEFRIDNSNQSAYTTSFMVDASANATIGNPFLGGTNVAWQSCQTGTGGRVKVGQILIQENSSADDVTLTVRQHFTPSSVDHPCAAAVLCDAPVYTMVCIGAMNSDHWRAVMNPTGAINGDCVPVAVEQTTWTQLKSMYQN